MRKNETISATNYSGYKAKIEFDNRDSIFVGRLLGIRTMISFHGGTVVELRAASETAVDEFLTDCKDQGVKSEKPASGKLMLRVSPEIHGAALVAAQASGKSLNQWAGEVLQEAAHVCMYK
jgi:predicted HicB family RNase H-like nuclease